jgi:hypothetical protein
MTVASSFIPSLHKVGLVFKTSYGLGSAQIFAEPEPPQAGPKPRLLGQAGPLLVQSLALPGINMFVISNPKFLWNALNLGLNGEKKFFIESRRSEEKKAFAPLLDARRSSAPPGLEILYLFAPLYFCSQMWVSCLLYFIFLPLLNVAFTVIAPIRVKIARVKVAKQNVK